ncbi:hypothetical protein T484DRAFT_1932858 [Baffinella frigidus]|nr:hypothetical protein T484DRAFT_1932858 [Cryptophyta sp. CCMP2293]
MMRGWSPLLVAASEGDADATRKLLDAGVDVGEKNSNGKTALHHAASAGSPEVVRMLLDTGWGGGGRRIDAASQRCEGRQRGDRRDAAGRGGQPISNRPPWNHAAS